MDYSHLILHFILAGMYQHYLCRHNHPVSLIHTHLFCKLVFHILTQQIQEGHFFWKMVFYDCNFHWKALKFLFFFYFSLSLSVDLHIFILGNVMCQLYTKFVTADEVNAEKDFNKQTCLSNYNCKSFGYVKKNK
jgi:hypothetical protein